MVADLLRVQALIFLATPFIALPEALLIRELDFKRPAIANLAATFVSAVVALACALGGLGVWTLVYAPLAFFWTRAIVLVLAARFFVLPSFRFAGAGRMFNFGLMLLGGYFFWTILTQADVFIAARFLSAHELGLYAEALFLTTIIAAKFVPPLNEVAFPAYARIQDDPAALTAAFLKAVRLIMLVTCPLYFGLAVVAQDAVDLVLGAEVAGDGAARRDPRLRHADVHALQPVRPRRDRARAHRHHHAQRDVRRAGHAGGVPVRHPVGGDRARLGLGAGLPAGAGRRLPAVARPARPDRCAAWPRRSRPGIAAGASMARRRRARRSSRSTAWRAGSGCRCSSALGGASYLALVFAVSRETLLEVVGLIARRGASPTSSPPNSDRGPRLAFGGGRGRVVFCAGAGHLRHGAGEST